jgi:4-hydroxy-4-methyl-2-oxoglutarate aldolase
MTDSRRIVGSFEQLSTPAIADALEGKGVLPSYIHPIFPTHTVAGPAYTVDLPPGDNLGIHVALARARPNSVIVAVTGSDVEGALWGAITSTAAAAAGIRAFVTDGYVRDSPQLSDIGIPVLARGISLRRVDKVNPGRHDVPCVVAGVAIHPNDIVVVDSDGAVIVPRAKADVVISDALSLQRQEEGVFKGIREGKTTIELLDLPGAASLSGENRDVRRAPGSVKSPSTA